MGAEFNRLGDRTDELEIDLRQLWTALMRRKWLIIGLFAVACASAYLVSNAMTPVYEATTTVLVNQKGMGLDAALYERLTGQGTQTALQRAVEVLRSRSLALRVARSLGYDWNVQSPELEAFRQGISVQSTTGSEVLKISVQHPDPEEAMRIANAVVSVFIQMSQERNSESVRAAREFIGEQLVKFEAELEKAEEDLVYFRQQASMVQPAGETQAILNGITALETLRAEALVAREAATERLNALRGELARETRSVVSGNVIASNPVITSIRSQLVSLESELAAAREQYTDAHPRVVGLQARINELRSELNREIARLESTDTETRLSGEVISLQAEIMALTAKIDAIDKLVQEREALLGDLPEKELHLTRLMRNASVTESIYTMLRQRYEEMRIAEAMEAADVSVLDPAIPPKRPVKPRKTLNMAIAGFLGAFVGVGLALLLEFLDTTFKTPEEVEAYLGLPVLGRTPNFDFAAAGKRSRSY